MITIVDDAGRGGNAIPVMTPIFTDTTIIVVGDTIMEADMAAEIILQALASMIPMTSPRPMVPPWNRLVTKDSRRIWKEVETVYRHFLLYA